MFTDSRFQELLHFTSEHPVLSVYLNTDPSEGNAAAYLLRLRTMLKKVDLPQDVDAVEKFFRQDYDWSGRSIAVFSCKPEDFLRAYPIAIPVTDQVMVSDRPSVRPLADLLDNYGGYAVALVDKQGARLFSFHLGELQEQEGTVGESVKHTKRGGASSFPGRRGGIAGRNNYQGELIGRNMREAVDFSVKFFEENHARRILIGGTDENISLFRSHLPKTWQSLIIGEFPMEFNSAQKDVLERAMLVGHESMQKSEQQVVENLETLASKGEGAFTGLIDTLQSVNQKRVLTLVVNEGFHANGYYCQECKFLLTLPECSNCNGKAEMVTDVVDSAMGAVLKLGGDVEVIRNNQRLEKIGHIGAFVRY